MAYQYPFDPNGTLASNYIKDEYHSLTEVNANAYRIIIPKFAPFYIDNSKLIYIDQQGTRTDLVEGIDYHLCLPYLGATRSIGKMLYGAFTLLHERANGSIAVEYRTLGDKWMADARYVLARLTEMVYNPRTTVWDVVTNVQETFPPINHDQHFDYVMGQAELVDAVNNIANQIYETGSASTPFVRHILDLDNPHEVSKHHLGLGDVENLPLATDNEVLNEQNVNKYITLRQVLLLLRQKNL